MKYLHLITCVLFIQSAFSDEPKAASWLKKEWLSPPSDGKSRPLWFFDVWLGAGAMISGSVLLDEKIKNKADDTNLEVSVFVNKKEETKFRLREVSVKIDEVMFSNESIVEDDTSIRKGGIATLFVVDYFDPKSNSWKQSISDDELKAGIFFIKEIGIASPGMYHIAWTMPMTRGKDLEKIIKSRNRYYSELNAKNTKK